MPLLRRSPSGHVFIFQDDGWLELGRFIVSEFDSTRLCDRCADTGFIDVVTTSGKIASEPCPECTEGERT